MKTDAEIIKSVCDSYRPLGIGPWLYARLRFELAPMVATARLADGPDPVLDLGCGNGMFAGILRALRPNRKIFGIDQDASRIATARRVIGGSGVEFAVGDVSNFELGSTTQVAIIDVLHHIPRDAQRALLTDLATRMKSGTKLLVKDLEVRPRWKYWLHYVQDSLSYRSRLFFRSREEMSALLESQGYSVQVVRLGGLHPHIAYVCVKI